MNAAEAWFRSSALATTDGAIQTLAHLFARFYLTLVLEGVPAEQAVLLTPPYIQAFVMGSAAQQKRGAAEDRKNG